MKNNLFNEFVKFIQFSMMMLGIAWTANFVESTYNVHHLLVFIPLVVICFIKKITVKK
jgi:hypothetical protein